MCVKCIFILLILLKSYTLKSQFANNCSFNNYNLKVLETERLTAVLIKISKIKNQLKLVQPSHWAPTPQFQILHTSLPQVFIWSIFGRNESN
jgi:hypothetical protein